MAHYEAVVVDRAQASGTAPILSVVGPILGASGLTWTDELNRDGSANISFLPEAQTAAVKTQLLDLPNNPSELRIYRDSVIEFAGPILTVQIQGQAITLNARGLMYYLRYMWLTTDLSYSATEQFTIARGLVAHWQALTYGDYGIDTSAVTTSGVTRTRNYPFSEGHNIYERIRELAEVDDGFDLHISPIDRDLDLFYASRGSDLSTSVIIDQRMISNPDAWWSVAAGDLASEAFAVGTSDSGVLTSTVSDASLRAAFGRTGVHATFDGVSVQATLDDHGQRMLDRRLATLFHPNPKFEAGLGIDVGDFNVGDTVAYSFDAGLGLQSVDRRVYKKTVTVHPDKDQETISVEFI